MKNEVLLLIVISVVALICIITLVANIAQIFKNRKRYKTQKAKEAKRDQLILDIASELEVLAKSSNNVVVCEEKEIVNEDAAVKVEEEVVCDESKNDDVIEEINNDDVIDELSNDDVAEKIKNDDKCEVNSYDKLLKEINELKDVIKNNAQVTATVQAVQPIQYVPVQYVPVQQVQYQPIQYQPMQCQPMQCQPTQRQVEPDNKDIEPAVKDELVKELEISEPEIEVVNDDAVFFSSKKDMTLIERYNELTKEEKSYFDEIASYAAEQENVKVIENNKYKEYKIGNNKVVRLEVKRNTVVASFIFIGADLRKYSRENKVIVKQKATAVKIVSPDDVQFAKNSIDLVIKQIKDDIIAKKELQKEKRRQKNLEKQGETK